MYEGIRRERQYRMQTLSGQGSANNLSTQSLTGAFIAILLFALAGLISGFAVGAFVRPSQQQQANNSNPIVTPTIPSQHKTPVHTPYSSPPVQLGIPVIDQLQYTEAANGVSSYTLSAHAIDKQNQQPMHKTGITCKLWLTRDGKVSANMPESRLQSINTLAQPFPKEVQHGLIFDPLTQQTQACNSGQGTWSYKVSPLIDDGRYYLVILTDWNGIHYNWIWVQISITR